LQLHYNTLEALALGLETKEIEDATLPKTHMMEQSAGALLSQLKEKVRDVVGFDSLSLKRKANVCFYLN
jgi:hypothetical protein